VPASKTRQRDKHKGGIASVEHENNCQTDTDNGCPGIGEDQSDNHNSQKASSVIGIAHSISPGAPCPETVLVVLMSNGSYLLVGYPQGEPAAFVTGEDAGSLRQVLTAAFEPGHQTDEGATGNGTSTSENNGQS
jgi:hypothetical protein